MVNGLCIMSMIMRNFFRNMLKCPAVRKGWTLQGKAAAEARIFLFNIEHPVFTAGVGQDWIYTEENKPLYWPVDRYFLPGERKTRFLGCDVTKQHHTLTQIAMGLLNNGFEIQVMEEAVPPEEMMDIPGMEDELRRPMMLLIRAGREKGGVMFPPPL